MSAVLADCLFQVLVASSKRDGSVRDPREEERLVRLFVIVPKSYSEDDVRKEFEVSHLEI